MAVISVKSSPQPERRDADEEKPAHRPVRSRRLLLALLLTTFTFAGAAALTMHRRELLAASLEVLHAMETLGPLRGTLLLCLLQSIGFVLLIPTSFLSVAAGCAFGLSRGVAAAGIGYLVGCLLPFYLSRCVLSATATRFVRRYPLASGILAAVEEQPFLLVTLLRLSPALPAPVNCYLLGLTRVHVLTYLAATAVGAAPNCVVCVYLGSLMHTVAEVLEGGTAPPWQLLVLGLCATLVFLGVLSTIAR